MEATQADKHIKRMTYIINAYNALINNQGIESVALELSSLAADTSIDVNTFLNTDIKTLKEIVKYCNNYIADPPSKKKSNTSEIRLSQWNKNFFHSLDQKGLFEVITAANAFNIEPLVDVTCLFVALKLKKMAPRENHQQYGITKEFTPEEEANARRDFENMILGL